MIIDVIQQNVETCYNMNKYHATVITYHTQFKVSADFLMVELQQLFKVQLNSSQLTPALKVYTVPCRRRWGLSKKSSVLRISCRMGFWVQIVFFRQTPALSTVGIRERRCP